MSINVNMIHGTRPCIAILNIQVVRTDEELMELAKESHGFAGIDVTIDTNSHMWKEFCRTNGAYWKKREVKAEWHMFVQETEEDENGNIQYPMAIIELEDGTVHTVNATDIKFIDKEEDNE